ncbi:hypothetical protein D3C80_1568170 [compost metagenome]
MGGKRGGLWQRRAPHPVLAPAGQGAGRGQVRLVAADGVRQALHRGRGVAGRAYRQDAGSEGQDTVRGALCQRSGQPVPERAEQGGTERRGRTLRLLRAEGVVRGVRQLRPWPWPRSGPLRSVSRGPRPALARGGRQGDPVALSRRLRPLCEGGRGGAFLRQARWQGGDLRAAL